MPIARQDPLVARVAHGAIIGDDDVVHLDLDTPHVALSPDDARTLAAELVKIANLIDPQGKP